MSRAPDDPGPSRPRAFRLDAPGLKVSAPIEAAPPPEDTGRAAADVPRDRPGLVRWGALFWSAIAGLIGLWAIGWAADSVMALFARQDALGTAALALLAVAIVSAVVILAAELWGIARVRAIAGLRADAARALAASDQKAADAVFRGVKALYADRPDLAWSRARLADHERDVRSGTDMLALAERELLGGLDARGKALIAGTARRISVATALNPFGLLNVLIVLAGNLTLIRKLARLYGGRPGTLGALALARRVAAHLAISGGVALGDDLVHQVLGHGLAARLSARLGEGALNGALTARIGLAAMVVCRPLPFTDLPEPRFRDVIGRVAGLSKAKAET